MNVLLLGGGGREHALAWRLAQSPLLGALWCAPGSDAIAEVADCVALDPCDPAAVALFARARAIDLVVVGPEAPLEAGVVDALEEAGVAAFGPTAAAARLETSKSFAREVATAVGAPGPWWARAETLDAARALLAARGAPIVVKADGLAAGKGVTVAETVAEADAALAAIFAEAGAAAVLEERMTGVEASLFALCDGVRALPFGAAQDHKRAFDGDRGPNTGGMGAFAPSPVMTEAVEARAMAEIVEPVVAEMARRGAPYRGVLYAGLMVEDGAPRLVEFNARFGDPETQALMPLLDADPLPLFEAAARGRLGGARPVWRPGASATVVIAAQGYPGAYAKGERIRGVDAAGALEGVTLFHAGTRRDAEGWVSAGGRVLAATGVGRDVAEAAARAYGAVALIDWPGGFHRSDIAASATG